jgi:hypothetical protein
MEVLHPVNLHWQVAMHILCDFAASKFPLCLGFVWIFSDLNK